MKQLTLLLFLFLYFGAYTQNGCSTCLSIEEALERPEKVTHLILKNQGLDQFPEEIKHFSQLIYLDLSGNDIQTFPEDWEFNPILSEINLRNNIGLMSSSFFEFAKNMIQLEIVNLENCNMYQVSSRISLIKSVRELIISGNKLKTIPQELEMLPKLEKLILSNNEIEDIPYTLSNLWELKYLDISKNESMKLSGIMNSISTLDQLHTLLLSIQTDSCNLSKYFREISPKRVEFINSSFVRIPSPLFQNPNIKELRFNNCSFGNSTEQNNDLKKMSNLSLLEFFNCSSLPLLKELKNIDELFIYNSDGLATKDLIGLKTLNKLNLSGQQVTNEERKELMTSLPQTEITFAPQIVDLSIPPNKKSLSSSMSNNYSVNSNQGKTIQLQYSHFTIPEEAFVTSAGEVYDGDVSIAIKEYSDPISMFLEGIPMIFDNLGTTEIFGSNAMIDFRASDSVGNELFPNEIQPITVELIDRQPENRGELFYLNDTTRAWERAPENNLITFNNATINLKHKIDSIMAIPDHQLVSIQSIPVILRLRSKTKRLDPSELEFDIYVNNDLIRNGYKQKYNRVYFETNFDQQFISRHTWKLDTIMTPDLKNKLSEIRRNQRLPRKKEKKKRKRTNYIYSSRSLKNLSIVPDFDKDHFVLSFDYKNEKVQLPVYLNNSTTNKKMIDDQHKFYIQYLKKQAQEERYRTRINAAKAASLKHYAEISRLSRIRSISYSRLPDSVRNSYNSMPTTSESLIDRAEFGLTRFGTVNIDYFFKNPPDYFVAMEESLINTDKDSIHRPNEVSLILPSTNTYINAPAQYIPYYTKQKMLVLFRSDEENIHVGKIVNNKWVVHSFSINGLSSKSIKNKILSFR